MPNVAQSRTLASASPISSRREVTISRSGDSPASCGKEDATAQRTSGSRSAIHASSGTIPWLSLQ